MINIAELLKDAPKGMKLYSPLFGEVEYMQLGDENKVWVKTSCGTYYFDKYSKPYAFDKAECLLFPSKDCRTWEGWKAPKSHYDIKNFYAGMPVLVRDEDCGEWKYVLFSHYRKNIHPFCAGGQLWFQCIPFEGNEHLLGTIDMCDEMYVNW